MITAAVILAASVIIFAVLHFTGGSTDTNVVYEDMRDSFESSGLLSANIGLITKNVQDDTVTYGEFGSGVIFKKNDGMYYALTAAHVVSAEHSELLVFTVNTDMRSENIPGLEGLNVLSADAYDSMYKAEIMFVSSLDDLAVIRFTTDEELSVMEFADNDPGINDRIMCVGNPQNEWFRVSYGKVTSGIERFGEFKGFPSRAMKHTAYIQVGSSGGAAINEQMRLVGITPGASLSLDKSTFNYGVMIPVSEIRKCLDEWTDR